MYFSVKHMAIIPQRTFKDGSEMYDDAIPLKERLPISEWFFQLWKRAVQDGEKDHGVKINVGDLEKLIVMEVANSEAKEIVFKAQQEVGGNAAKTSSSHKMRLRLTPYRTQAPEFPAGLWFSTMLASQS